MTGRITSGWVSSDGGTLHEGPGTMHEALTMSSARLRKSHSVIVNSFIDARVGFSKGRAPRCEKTINMHRTHHPGPVLAQGCIRGQRSQNRGRKSVFTRDFRTT